MISLKKRGKKDARVNFLDGISDGHRNLAVDFSVCLGVPGFYGTTFKQHDLRSSCFYSRFRNIPLRMELSERKTLELSEVRGKGGTFLPGVFPA